MMDSTSSLKIDVQVSLDDFKEKLQDEITARDLSKEKIKNASLLGIKLAKFKGYDSVLDFYSFKSEFDKLIVPRVQAKLLPDHLKNNYLEGQAYRLVKEIDDLDEIWERLKRSFGNVATLLCRKMKELESTEPLWKIKTDEKRIIALPKIINVMLELVSLAEKHDIESELYHISSLSKVFQQVGRDRQRKIMRKFDTCVSGKIDNKILWNNIVDFLKGEVQVLEQMALFNTVPSDESLSRQKDKSDNSGTAGYLMDSKSNICHFCGKDDHVPTISKKGNVFINYFSCEKFVKLSAKERFDSLRKKGFCLQCLTPGKLADHSGACFDSYCCPHDSHKTDSHVKGLHVLICFKHKDDDANKKLLESYKSKFITFPNSGHKDFSKNVSFYSSHLSLNSINDVSVYRLQKLELDGHYFNVMFDDGCGDGCFKRGAVEVLKKLGRAMCTYAAQCTLEGVGGQTSVAPHGRFAIKLPLHDGTEIEIEGICLDVVTGKFPTYPLDEVEKDLHQAYESTGGSINDLPRLYSEVGGETDIMIGSQYLKYFPEKIFALENGFTLYESHFASPDGSRGVVCGPHRFFSDFIRQSGCHYSHSADISDSVRAYNSAYRLRQEITLLSDFSKDPNGDIDHSISGKSPDILGDIGSRFNALDSVGSDFPIMRARCTNCPTHYSSCYWAKKPSNLARFEEVDLTGTDVSYRCVRCRACPDCVKSGKIESISIQEEIEQEIINKSVSVHLDKGLTIAKLPFLCDPHRKLAPNLHQARKIYNAQLRKINSNPKSKSDVILAERKLHDLGYVAFYDDLSVDQKEKIQSSATKYFYPWRIVQNKNSITTPFRPVFDASHPTSSGFSLNDIVAKGRNNMNNLVMIFIRWMTRRFAYHTDVQKMYNTVLLREEDWAFQLYLWDDDLNPENEPKMKVIKTIIYGVKSSGNQAERGFRETARLQKDQFPRVYEVVQDDTYVDDCMSGEDTARKRDQTTDQLPIVLSKGGFSLKGFTFSGYDPPDDLTQPDKSINVAGMKWFSKPDVVSLSLDDMKLDKRGKRNNRRPIVVSPIVPDSFTRRDCAGRVAEVYDLVGKCTPIIAGFKLDLRELCKRKLDWDDRVPDDLVSLWKLNFEKISDLRQVKFKRLIVPEDAVDLNLDTIEISDASLTMACAATYGRFKRKNGEYSCQLIFARSKIIPEGFNIPRAELIAAVLNATTGHMVYLALGDLIKDRLHVVDNQIILFWITNRRSDLKQWVRNKVTEITRLTNRDAWVFIDSENNIADLGTRKGVEIADISEGSEWLDGPAWAKQDRSLFPVKSVADLRLSQDELLGYNAEVSELLDEEWINKNIFKSYSCHYSALTDDSVEKIRKRYQFSDYILDPNKFRFRKVVRILALVFLFISKAKARINKQLVSTVENSNLPKHFQFCNDQFLVTEGKYEHPFSCEKGKIVMLTENLLRLALNYYFKKGTLEVIHFLAKNCYEKISKEVNGVLHYTGRILPTQGITNHLQLADVCLDLTSSTFFVPLLDKFSPISFSVINEIHWYSEDACHSGNESVWRYVQHVAYILEGKPLVKQFREECPRCRYLRKKAIEVAMGPVSDDQLKIASPFYVSQVDLFGPFNSYSNVHQRAKTKIWFVIFCCCATGAVSIKVMWNYSTASFIFAFIRFSCAYGYPYKLLPDAGSQLVKGCESIELTYTDVKTQLHEAGVIFEVCPVGAHYMHGKVERKIRSVKESFAKCLQKERLSEIEWETLGDQVANTLNNLPIGLKSETKDLENIDLLTPNRLLLARNNNRCPVGPLRVTEDVGQIVERNENVFTAWFRAWLISHVPNLMLQPKWFRSNKDPKIGDVILFLKSDKEFERIFQYGMIYDVKASRDGLIREVEVLYQNPTEKTKRFVSRGVREIVVIHHVEELGLIRELNMIVSNM